MEKQFNQETLHAIENYHLPRFMEIPNVGLYLNQAARFINEYLEPFYDMNITESMISNYVKKHLVANPQKKQYNREQLAYLLFIAVAKSVLSLDNIRCLITLQQQTYESHVAYDYFCCEFENILQYVFGIKDTMEPPEPESNDMKVLFHNVINTVAHKIYLDCRFHAIEEGITKQTTIS